MSVPVSKPAGDAAAANGGAAKAAATSMVVDAFSAKVAGAIKPVLDKAGPAFAILSQVFAIVFPYIEMAFTFLAVLWEKLQPYHPQEFMPAIAGFCLVFFGGNFFTLAAAVEAYRMVGFDETKTALIALHKSYKVALDASKKDDEVDDDATLASRRQADLEQGARPEEDWRGREGDRPRARGGRRHRHQRRSHGRRRDVSIATIPEKRPRQTRRAVRDNFSSTRRTRISLPPD